MKVRIKNKLFPEVEAEFEAITRHELYCLIMNWFDEGDRNKAFTELDSPVWAKTVWVDFEVGKQWEMEELDSGVNRVSITVKK